MSELGDTGAQTPRERSKVDIKSYLFTMWESKWVILACVVVATSTAVLAAFRAEPVYEAVAQLEIERQTRKVTNFFELYQIASYREYYRTQHQLIKSNEVLEMAVDVLGEDFFEDESSPRRKKKASSFWNWLGRLNTKSETATGGEALQSSPESIATGSPSEVEPGEEPALAKASVCQCCGMLMNSDAEHGSNADGSKNEDYCHLCYQKGSYTEPRLSVETIISRNVERLVADEEKPEAEARAEAETTIADLKRWRIRLRNRRRLKSWVKVDPVTECHLVNVKVSLKGPHAAKVARKAAKAANAVVQAFKDWHDKRNVKQSNRYLVQLQKQKDKQYQALQKAETDLQKYQNEIKYVSLNRETEANPAVKRLAILSHEATQAEMALKKLEAEVGTVDRALVEPQAKSAEEALTIEAVAEVVDKALAGKPLEALLMLQEVREDPLVRTRQAERSEAQGVLAALLTGSGFTEESPQAVAANERIKLLDKQFENTVRSAARSVIAAKVMEMQAYQESEAKLRDLYEKQNEDTLKLSKVALKFRHLENEIRRQEELFEKTVERWRQLELTEESPESAETTNVKVAQKADVPQMPAGPNKGQQVLAGMLFGLILGIGLGFYLDYLDGTIKTRDDVTQHVGIPTLGIVPDIAKIKSGKDPVDVEGDGFAQRAKVSIIDPGSPISDAYRGIRTSIRFSSPGREVKTILITSVTPQEGKTTTASNLALVMSQVGDRVLLVDADLRKPMIHQVFGLKSNQRGLTDLLVDKKLSAEELIVPAEYDNEEVGNLDVLLCGTSPEQMRQNPAELLSSSRMRRFVNRMRQKYDWVILDSPPTIFPDAGILASLCDGVALVMKAEKCKRGDALQAKERLESANGRILGALVNDLNPRRAAFYGHSDSYQYNYRKYYGYYYGSKRRSRQS